MKDMLYLPAMTNPDVETTPAPGGYDEPCRYPDCTRPRRPSHATPGRPSLYCEQANPGGPVHNAANAWKERERRRRGKSSGDGGAQDGGRPVSLAKLSLEDQLGQLPGQIDGLIRVLNGIRENVNTIRDREAVAAEVDQVHADALARTAEADRLRGLAEQRAREAQHDKDEADAAARAALAQAEESAQAAEAALHRARVAEEQIAELQNARAAAQDAAREALARQQAEAQAEIDHVRDEAQQRVDEAVLACTRAEADTANAKRQAEAASTEVAQLRAELAQVRSDAIAEQSRLLDEARNERESLRAQYAEQLAQIQQNADARVAALTQALDLARDAAAAYRAQLSGHTDPDSPAADAADKT
jgi:DNA repair exonuclease SbcCD ATPase subunit